MKALVTSGKAFLKWVKSCVNGLKRQEKVNPYTKWQTMVQSGEYYNNIVVYLTKMLKLEENELKVAKNGPKDSWLRVDSGENGLKDLKRVENI